MLAELPREMRDRGQPPPFQLIVTTNYDDALEQAFKTAGQAFDLVYYAAGTEQKPGEFVHMVKGKPVRVTQQYRKLMLDDTPTVLKIHGAVDREDETRDSYVVTEDHYIDYLARTNLDKLIPASLMREMRTSHFLFLGYGMRDWNLRVILKHVWAEQRRRGVSWAVQHDADEIDREVLEPRGRQRRHHRAARLGRRDATQPAVTTVATPARHVCARRRARRRFPGSSRTRSPTRRTSSAATSGPPWSSTTFSRTACRSSTARAASARARFSPPARCINCIAD